MKAIFYKNVPFVKQSFKEEGDYFTFSGYGSTFDNVDLGDDRVIKGAFENSLKNDLPQMFYMHSPYNPIGVWTSAKEDNIGLFLEGKMPMGNTDCKNIAELIKIGAIKSLSIGYRVQEYELNGKVRDLKKLDLIEVSPVSIPMNPKAVITGMKSKLKNICSMKDIEGFLRHSFCMSVMERKILISKIKEFSHLRDVDDGLNTKTQEKQQREVAQISDGIDKLLLTLQNKVNEHGISAN